MYIVHSDWASSTGLTVVSKFKPRLPAHWAVGTHRKGPSKGHRSHILGRFERNFVCHMTYLPISPQERPRFEFPYRGNLQQPVEFKTVRTEK